MPKPIGSLNRLTGISIEKVKKYIQSGCADVLFFVDSIKQFPRVTILHYLKELSTQVNHQDSKDIISILTWYNERSKSTWEYFDLQSALPSIKCANIINLKLSPNGYASKELEFKDYLESLSQKYGNDTEQIELTLLDEKIRPIIGKLQQIIESPDIIDKNEEALKNCFDLDSNKVKEYEKLVAEQKKEWDIYDFDKILQNIVNHYQCFNIIDMIMLSLFDPHALEISIDYHCDPYSIYKKNSYSPKHLTKFLYGYLIDSKFDTIIQIFDWIHETCRDYRNCICHHRDGIVKKGNNISFEDKNFRDKGYPDTISQDQLEVMASDILNIMNLTDITLYQLLLSKQIKLIELNSPK